MLAQVFLLLVLFQIKHFLCDYPFQTPYMLGKGRYRGWAAPLALHAGCHALGTILVVATFRAFGGGLEGYSPLLPALDFAIHFTVDRVKASPALGGRWGGGDRFFWWALGADQAAHHLTHYVIIFCLIRGQG